jgi:predicted ATP-binding protein involved in virulence
MNISRLKITGLFDLFNYDVPLNTNEELTIITGPNGFGKTMILNILFSMFNRRFFFFQKLVYTKIEIFFDEEYRIEIEKSMEPANRQKTITFDDNPTNEVEVRSKVHFGFYKQNQILDGFDYSNKQEEEFSRLIERYIPLQRISDDQWIDRRIDKTMFLDEIVHEYRNVLPEKILKSLGNDRLMNEEAIQLLNSLNVHLIKEQRLLKQTNLLKRSYPERTDTFLTNTIQEYAEDLSLLIKKKVDESFQVTRELDSTFPKRLLEEKGKLSNKEFNGRFEQLKSKQERLIKFGLSASQQEVPLYDEQNAKVLLVYLNDSEKKTEVFDELLNRIELFTDILNKRRFTFKTIQIDRDKGFIFLTNKKKKLNLTDLSSGEQHEVVLLYELIFKAKSNTLVLIDEPEISLHVSWQTEFLNDLLQIIKLQKVQVIIATHSPQIINDNWYLTVDLAKQVKL